MPVIIAFFDESPARTEEKVRYRRFQAGSRCRRLCTCSIGGLQRLTFHFLTATRTCSTVPGNMAGDSDLAWHARRRRLAGVSVRIFQVPNRRPAPIRRRCPARGARPASGTLLRCSGLSEYRSGPNHPKESGCPMPGHVIHKVRDRLLVSKFKTQETVQSSQRIAHVSVCPQTSVEREIQRDMGAHCIEKTGGGPAFPPARPEPDLQ